MQLTKKQIEFWGFILGLCLITSIAVLVVDFGIKSAILEESLRLRGMIEREEVIRAKGNSGGIPDSIDVDASVDAPLPSDLLVDKSSGLEERNSANGHKAATPIPGTRNTKSRRSNRSPEVSGGSEPV